MYKITDMRKWRMNAGISQAEMGKILDIPKRTIENWESGKNTPPQYIINLVTEKLIQLSKNK
ncbi:MAG: helix-turn-helix transcriptional regulator [Eubacterium sp.]|nr:helix-turn-helix transcriptional regulator [Eubacterium sp.]